MSPPARNKLHLPRTEVRMAGSGGQGIVLAGLILAEATGVWEGREVAMVQSYGPEARGGASRAEVIISDEEIDYPQCTHVDIFVALSQEAADAYAWDLKPFAWMIVDADMVKHPPSSRAIPLPFTVAAREKLKKTIAANVVALGALSEVTAIVSRRSLEKALLERGPKAPEGFYKKALNLGARLARAHQRGKIDDSKQEAAAEDI